MLDFINQAKQKRRTKQWRTIYSKYCCVRVLLSMLFSDSFHRIFMHTSPFAVTIDWVVSIVYLFLYQSFLATETGWILEALSGFSRGIGFSTKASAISTS